MMKQRLLFLMTATSAWANPSSVEFDWFRYEGMAPPGAEASPENAIRNPILPGFYSDPSIVRVGGDYYLINSSFAYFPGIPLFHSRDLVHWRQLGHVLDRPSQLDLDGHAIRRGIFAPTISHHDGLFYVVVTVVDTFGNFFVTAEDPAGPWSDPIRLPEVDGIDPSFFFDDDGRAWLVNNGPPPENAPLYEGHRAIWLQEFDVAEQRLIGPRRIIVNGGVDLAEKPIWIEGPHLFKRDGWYYLSCAEGGTSVGHHQVVFRTRSLDEPFEPWEGNPILDQRGQPEDRPFLVTSVGHADLFDTPQGDWYAVFLGCRPFEDGFYNLGRETFLLPVDWTDDGWPVILPKGEAVPEWIPAPSLKTVPEGAGARAVTADPEVWRDDFDAVQMRPEWVFVRTPREAWWRLDGRGTLAMIPRPATMDDLSQQPSFLGRRQQHQRFVAETAVTIPEKMGSEAGLMALHDERHHFFVAVRRGSDGPEVFVRRTDGEATEVAKKSLPSECANAKLRIEGGPGFYRLAYALPGGDEAWETLSEEDGRILTVAHSWGFTGAMIGLHAVTKVTSE